MTFSTAVSVLMFAPIVPREAATEVIALLIVVSAA
jgi:hypothetical protein